MASRTELVLFSVSPQLGVSTQTRIVKPPAPAVKALHTTAGTFDHCAEKANYGVPLRARMTATEKSDGRLTKILASVRPQASINLTVIETAKKPPSSNKSLVVDIQPKPRCRAAINASYAFEHIRKSLFFLPSKVGSVVITERVGLFRYRDIARTHAPLFLEPPAHLIQGKASGKYIQAQQKMLLKEIDRLDSKYNPLYREFSDCFIHLLNYFRGVHTLEEYSSFCKKEAAFLRILLFPNQVKKEEGKESGNRPSDSRSLSDDMDRFHVLLATFDITAHKAAWKKAETDPTIKEISFYNPFSDESIFVNKSSQTWKTEYQELTKFFSMYHNLLKESAHFLQNFTSAFPPIFTILEGFPGPYVTYVGRALEGEKPTYPTDHFKLPEALRLLPIYPPLKV